MIWIIILIWAIAVKAECIVNGVYQLDEDGWQDNLEEGEYHIHYYSIAQADPDPLVDQRVSVGVMTELCAKQFKILNNNNHVFTVTDIYNEDCTAAYAGSKLSKEQISTDPVVYELFIDPTDTTEEVISLQCGDSTNGNSIEGGHKFVGVDCSTSMDGVSVKTAPADQTKLYNSAGVG